MSTISYYITELPNKIDWLNVGMNLVYINSFGPGHYLNVVYWIMGIEFQFYLIIALVYPLIKNKNTLSVFILTLIALSCIPMPAGVSLIFPYLSVFWIGTLVFYYQIKKTIDLDYFLFLSLILLIQIYFFLELPVLISAIICVLILLFWRYDNKVINFFSTFSFSLYLTHVTIGGRIVNLGLRFADAQYERYLLFILALAVSIGLSYVFYLLIEKPAISWSKRIHYKIVKIA